MPTNRHRRRRPPVLPDAITALQEGCELQWSPEAWDELIGAYFFRDYNLSPDVRARARSLLDEWYDRQMAHEEKERGAR